ncbi:ras-related protein Rap1-like [Crassostrea angulata]|uniref:ras-related protein Rap1-like n=1 Tax=Magallana angulata TaxID=2784310 RepID=UPI0022B1C265|nr:ras-related protein Rap1-like [Crassostrea angulata]
MEGCFRIAVLGTKKVGKTCLIAQLLKKSFPDTYSPTIEALFQYNIQTSENKFAKLEILDTAGSFEFPDLLRKAVRSCHALVLMFDLSDSMRTFREVETLRQLILDERGGESVPLIVIGNKSDLIIKEDNVENKVLDAIVSIDWDCTYLTTSAKCDTNISDVYKAVCKGLGIDVRQTNVNDEDAVTRKPRKLSLSNLKRRVSSIAF